MDLKELFQNETMTQQLQNNNSEGVTLTLEQKKDEGVSMILEGFRLLTIKGEKGEKGEKPVKGVDYFTSQELQDLVDYILQRATPIKGIDYIEGKNGQPGRDGRNPTPQEVADIVLARIPKPKNGKNADEAKIIQEVFKRIPKPRDGNTPSIEAVAKEAIRVIKKEISLRDFKEGADIIGQVRLHSNMMSRMPKSLIEGDQRWGGHGGSSTSGVQSVVAGPGISVDNSDPQNPIVSATGGTITTGIATETPTGVQDAVNQTYTVIHTPLWITVNGQELYENFGYTLSGLTLTLDNPLFPSDVLRSEYISGTVGIAVGDLTGTQDGVNQTFTVSNVPLWITINGQDLYENFGYTRSGLTLTLDNAPFNTDLLKYHYTGGTGTGALETPTGTIDGSNKTFTVTATPVWVTVNGLSLYSGSGYTISGTTLTLTDAPFIGDVLRSHQGTTSTSSTGIQIETPVGTQDGSNTIFTVSNVPIWISFNGQEIFEGAGYTRSGTTITFDNPPFPTDVLRSFYTGGTSGTHVESLVGTENGVNQTFTVTNVPIWISVNGQSLFEGAGYTRSGLTLTLDSAPFANDVIRSHY